MTTARQGVIADTTTQVIVARMSVEEVIAIALAAAVIFWLPRRVPRVRQLP